jgi:hypothetical protein
MTQIKELKERVKAYRNAGFDKIHINLGGCMIEQLNDWLQETEATIQLKINRFIDMGYPETPPKVKFEELDRIRKWLTKADLWEDDQIEKSSQQTEERQNLKAQNLGLDRIGKAKTLSELGEAIVALSGIGKWKNWEFSLWTKNGECRIYTKDIGYTNPKQRGFIVIDYEGNWKNYLTPNSAKLELPPLPKVTDDLKKQERPDTHSRAIANLNRDYGANGWNQLDLEDELEREEYQ